MKCCICEDEIEVEHGYWDQGHNAEPVRDGRCCRVCNFAVVIPMRLRQAIPDKHITLPKEVN